MQVDLRLYKVVVGLLCVCAVGITMAVHVSVPIASNPWPSAVHFVVLTTLVSLLAVNLREGKGTYVSPASPIIWAATCVLGAFPAVVVGLSSAALSVSAECGCFYLSRAMKQWEHTAPDAEVSPLVSRLRQQVFRLVSSVALPWHDAPWRITVFLICSYLASVVLDVGPAGLAYYFLGGKFLISPGPDMGLIRDFGVPFVALVCVSSLAHLAEYAIVTASIDPIPGARGLYGLLLRMRLAIIETALPLVKGQLFLSVVALLLAYLYSQIGVLGFVLAITPVLALRDFFNQWVEQKSAYLNTVTTLATYMQHYHPYTRGHLKRVADLSERLARELRLPVDSIRHMNAAGFLHDIGKVGVSEEILDKTSKLTDEEWNRIKEHPVKGSEIISHMDFLEGIVDWIKYHHKWYDGRGYPEGNGSDVPIEAAIIATVDAFDAMTDDRELSLDWTCDSCGHRPEIGVRPDACPRCGAEKRRRYREPKSLDEAIDELRRGAGSQFHPTVVKAFLRMVERDGIKLNA